MCMGTRAVIVKWLFNWPKLAYKTLSNIVWYSVYLCCMQECSNVSKPPSTCCNQVGDIDRAMRGSHFDCASEIVGQCHLLDENFKPSRTSSNIVQQVWSLCWNPQNNACCAQQCRVMFEKLARLNHLRGPLQVRAVKSGTVSLQFLVFIWHSGHIGVPNKKK